MRFWRRPGAARLVRAAAAVGVAGAFLAVVPDGASASLTTGSTASPGAELATATTWQVTEQYATGSGVVTACPGSPAPGVPGAVGGGCFDLFHPYTDVASIQVADASGSGVDGSWQIADVNKNQLTAGPICNGKVGRISIPANAANLYVFLGGPPDPSCETGGSPVATTGTVTATFDIPSGSMNPNPAPPQSCPSGLQSGHAMPFLNAASTSPQGSVQPPPVVLPCGTPWPPPPAGQPSPVNMAYFGGHVQTNPKLYLVLWGWNRPNAFRDAPVSGNPSSDPDGAGARMKAFLGAMGGSQWANVDTQYYQTVNGVTSNITNPTGQLAGVWADDTNQIVDGLTQQQLGQEAQRAAVYFGLLNSDGSVPTGGQAALDSANFVIAQPQDYNDYGFSSGVGYCAWHDYTEGVSGYPYPGITPGISFTNMPYILNLGSSCGENAVNSGGAGLLDGVSIVLGHEVEETKTDPGAEDVVNGQNLGGWFDYSGYENGDKCAWVGSGLPIPGAVGTMTGNDGKQYPVQSIWSNSSAGGLGYCAGTNDLPAPLS